MILPSWKLKILSTGTVLLLSSVHPKKEEIPAHPSRSATVSPSVPGIKSNSSSQSYSIYLTFDDGPCAGSEKVNELALKDSLCINVFLIGKNAFETHKNRYLLQDYADNPYIEIGNHSYEHAERHYLRYFKDPRMVLDDFDRNKDSLDVAYNFARLPGRNFFRVRSLSRNDITGSKEAADTLASRGYIVFGWDVEWRNKANKGIALHTGKEMLAITEKPTISPGVLTDPAAFTIVLEIVGSPIGCPRLIQGKNISGNQHRCCLFVILIFAPE